ncbi:hypothetical protein DLAC_01280 [Tieghemostelium lacteum]|uniref:B box-type domain-containing protein n=1 Tax=Tieghemostelium lacteum TaxID=361077 RepID=A0A152A8L4_TIELA|nr:hypothetical protein DLAC_01280 [Tieghemostelium lacteum]|eukprot:KYR02441.1 hypothetical protein DLAC_01280 [Tieghemostelium lacteum]
MDNYKKRCIVHNEKYISGCVDCKTISCMKCVVSTHRGHSQIGLREYENLSCSLHRKPLDMVCWSCLMIQCADCIDLEHFTHNYGPIQKKSKAMSTISFGVPGKNSTLKRRSLQQPGVMQIPIHTITNNKPPLFSGGTNSSMSIETTVINDNEIKIKCTESIPEQCAINHVSPVPSNDNFLKVPIPTIKTPKKSNHNQIVNIQNSETKSELKELTAEEIHQKMLIKNLEKIINDNIKEAERGDVDCSFNVARAYSKLGMVEQSYGWYLHAAEKGNQRAQYHLACILEKGIPNVLLPDLSSASHWFFRSGNIHLDGEGGDKDAIFKMAIYYSRGTGGVEYNMDRSLELLRKGAKEGQDQCAYALGQYYMSTVKNSVEAIQWFTMSADCSYTRAYHDLGNCYRFNPNPNYSKAFECYLKSSPVYPVSINSIGEMYLNQTAPRHFIKDQKLCIAISRLYFCKASQFDVKDAVVNLQIANIKDQKPLHKTTPFIEEFKIYSSNLLDSERQILIDSITNIKAPTIPVSPTSNDINAFLNSQPSTTTPPPSCASSPVYFTSTSNSPQKNSPLHSYLIPSVANDEPIEIQKSHSSTSPGLSNWKVTKRSPIPQFQRSPFVATHKLGQTKSKHIPTLSTPSKSAYELSYRRPDHESSVYSTLTPRLSKLKLKYKPSKLLRQSSAMLPTTPKAEVLKFEHPIPESKIKMKDGSFYLQNTILENASMDSALDKCIEAHPTQTIPEAIESCKHLFKAGHNGAIAYAGYLYIQIKSKQSKGIEILKLAALDQNGRACYELAKHYQYSDPKIALYWAKKGTKYGYSRSMLIVGCVLTEDLHNFVEAKIWLNKYLELVDDMDTKRVVYRWLGVLASLTFKWEESVQFHQKSIEEYKYVTDSLLYLATCYYHGYGCKVDLEMALKLFEKAGRCGYSRGYIGAGLMYLRGEYVTQNSSIAMAFFNQAYSQDKSCAEGNIYSMYLEKCVQTDTDPQYTYKMVDRINTLELQYDKIRQIYINCIPNYYTK